MNDAKVALIAGAGSGVGRAAALLLAEAGYALALAGRTASKLQETARLVRERTLEARLPAAEAQVLPVDLADPAAARALVPAAVDLLGRLDALVNTAGFARLAPIEQVTPALWRQTIDGNLSYVVDLTAAAWPGFRAQGSGVIVNISSLASVDPFPHFSLYAAAKAGLNLFTRCAGREGQPLGIRVVCLAPGAIETPMLRALWSEQALPRAKTLDPRAVAAVIRDCVTGARQFEPGETILLPSP